MTFFSNDRIWPAVRLLLTQYDLNPSKLPRGSGRHGELLKGYFNILIAVFKSINYKSGCSANLAMYWATSISKLWDPLHLASLMQRRRLLLRPSSLRRPRSRSPRPRQAPSSWTFRALSSSARSQRNRLPPSGARRMCTRACASQPTGSSPPPRHSSPPLVTNPSRRARVSDAHSPLFLWRLWLPRYRFLALTLNFTLYCRLLLSYL